MEQKNVGFCMIHSPGQIDYCHYDLGDFKGVSGVLRMIPAPGSQDLHREIQIGTVATTLWSNRDRKGGCASEPRLVKWSDRNADGFAMKAGQKRDAKQLCGRSALASCRGSRSTPTTRGCCRDAIRA